MHYKKILSLTTALLITTSLLFSSTAFSEELSKEKINIMLAAGESPVSMKVAESSVKISRDTAVSIAKTMLEDVSLYETSNISLNPNYSSFGSIWSINFNKKEAPGGNVSVSINAENGEITNYNIWEGYNGEQNFIAKFTQTEARIKAEDYLTNQLKKALINYELQKEDPNLYQYKSSGVKQQVIYNYYYLKKVKDIPFINDMITISVDGTTGKITGFSKNSFDIPEAKFPITTGVLTPEAALNKYIESANVMLQYVTSYNQQGYGMSKPKVTLAYMPITYINMLDATSGKAINMDGSKITPETTEFKNLMEHPVSMLSNNKLDSNSLTDEQANTKANNYKSLIEGVLGVKFDDNNNSYSNYSSNGNLDSIWNYNWNKNAGNKNSNLGISVNGATGHITNIYFGNYDYSYDMAMKSGQPAEDIKEKSNWKESKSKVIELVKKILPNEYGFYVDENIAEPEWSAEAKKTMREYNFNFTRLVNGIRFRDNAINVSVNRETGEVSNFGFSWSDLDFPLQTSVIPKDEATKKYFNGATASLRYYLTSTYDKTGRTILGEVPQLIYSFNNTNYFSGYGNAILDAVSGKLLDFSGIEVKFQKPGEELKLNENWAKRSVELLSAQGILKKSTVDFDAGITKFEVIKMLTLAKGMYYYDPVNVAASTFKDVQKDNEYYSFVENAVKQKIITGTGAEFKGNEIISKSEFVKLLVGLIGYGDIAKYKDIFKVTGMVNVSDDNTGYAAICKALDLLPLAPGGTFDGASEVNYSEAAVALYKALNFIK